jgi:histidyl-tRNA synthetase
MGGPETPAIGWAMGIDRIALMLNQTPPQPRPISIIAVGDDVMEQAFQLAMNLRKQGVMVELSYSGNMAKRLKRADKANACAAVLVGADEIATAQATVRNLDTGEQKLVAFAGLKDYLVNTFSQPYRV